MAGILAGIPYVATLAAESGALPTIGSAISNIAMFLGFNELLNDGIAIGKKVYEGGRDLIAGGSDDSQQVAIPQHVVPSGTMDANEVKRLADLYTNNPQYGEIQWEDPNLKRMLEGKSHVLNAK